MIDRSANQKVISQANVKMTATQQTGMNPEHTLSHIIVTYSFKWLKSHPEFKFHDDEIEMWGFLDMTGDEKLTKEDYDVKLVLSSN